MTGEISIEESLVKQILDKMSIEIEGRDEFDAQTVHEFKKLIQTGDIKNKSKVIEFIKSTSGGKL